MGKRKPITYKGEKIIDTGLPQRAIKPIWLELHKEMRLRVAEAVKETSPEARKVVRLIRVDISAVLDEDLRKELKANIAEALEAEIKAAKENNGGTLSDSEIAKIEEDVYLDYYDSVTDYVDKAFGVSHRLAIGIA
jgi:hypothetical protein